MTAGPSPLLASSVSKGHPERYPAVNTLSCSGYLTKQWLASPSPYGDDRQGSFRVSRGCVQALSAEWFSSGPYCILYCLPWGELKLAWIGHKFLRAIFRSLVTA